MISSPPHYDLKSLHVSLADETEQRARIWKENKCALLVLKRVLREKLTLCPDHPAAEKARQLLLSLPRRIEARNTNAQLEEWSSQILKLITAFEQGSGKEGEIPPLASDPTNPEASETKPSEQPQNTFGRQKTSGRSEIQFRPINTNNTNQTLSNERSNAAHKRTLPSGNDLKSCRTANAEKALEKIKSERAARAGQLMFELADRPNSPLPSSSDAGCYASGIEHITLKQIVACASPMLQEMIRTQAPSSGADWNAVIAASQQAAGYLGISKPAWREACHKLGPCAAATVIVIAERRSTDTATPVNSYGGFLRGCLAKAESGDLHLHKSVFGLLSRANLDE